MLALRLIRGTHPVILLRRLLVAAASAGVGFLLLCALGYALGHPGSTGPAALRLLWCAVPLASTVHLAVTVARVDPGTRPITGLWAAGLGPVRLSLLAAGTTALSCTLGSVLALLFFLHLRGDITGLPFDGAAAHLLAADRPLPVPAALLLLSLVPLFASAITAYALRPPDSAPRPRRRKDATGPDADSPTTPAPSIAPTPSVPAAPSAPSAPSAPGTVDPTAPAGLPWGLALIAAGCAVVAYTGRHTPAAASPSASAPSSSVSSFLPLPADFTAHPGGLLTGWILTALGLAVAAPGLTFLCGRLLSSVRPGALRLLAGRLLQEEARHIGRPLGLLCATASIAVAISAAHPAGPGFFGPLTGLGAVLVLGCAGAALLTTAVETRHRRTDATTALRSLGAPVGVLQGAVALRTALLLGVFVPLTWVTAQLSALPLSV